MTFPTPDAVSDKTVRRYFDVWRRRLAAAQRNHPDSSGIGLIEHVVEDLLAERPSIAQSTFRQYKASIRYALCWAAARRLSSDPKLLKLNAVIARLSAEAGTGCIRRSNRTSALKAKRLNERDLAAIELDIEGRLSGSKPAQLTFAAITVLRLTGARPIELLQLEARYPSPAEVTVVIRNAKSTNGRGNGRERTLHLTDVSEAEIQAFRAWQEASASYVTGKESARLISSISKVFARAARRALGKRPKYPTLYSFRHQFAADAKASGLSAEAVAALMGHGSDVTATRHYGRRAAGSGGLKARPSAVNVSTVRRKAKPFRQGATRDLSA
ncbi:MAG: tyrosine-type recombinase/integrase [Steroidobacteraceae bacterium]|nr:tyrosine-type recombinase/integrase [Steroidobacteraceae bacterium]